MFRIAARAKSHLAVLRLIRSSRVLGALVIAALAMLSVPAAASATRYAAPTASGTGNCTTPANACTLPTALGMSADEIVLATGDYGSSGAPLPSFNIDFGYTVHGPATGALPRIFVGSGGGIQARGGTLRRVAVEGTGAAVFLNGGTVDQVYAHTSDTSSVFNSGCLIGPGTLTNSVCVGRSGASSSSTSSSIFLQSLTMRNVTLIGTVANGINLEVTGGISQAISATNVIARGAPGQTDIVAKGGTNTSKVTITLDHSNYATTSATNGSSVTPPGSGTNITAPPLLSADYHELSGSPTIDAGVTAAANGTSDLDGNARVRGSSTDVGAYEFTPPATGPATGLSPSPSPTPTPTPTPGQGPAPDTTRPVITGLSFSLTRFRAAGSGPSIATAIGTRVSYTISEAASVRFRVERALRGRRVGGRCVKLTRANRRAKACTRYTLMRGGFTHRGKAGRNRFRFSGRLAGRKLRPGRYRLRAVATDAAANKSLSRRRGFRIVRR